jgi:hypothetical protein
MTQLLTIYNGRFNTGMVYYAPTATIPVTGDVVGSIYCFLSRVQPWSNEATPPVPTQDQKYLKTVFKNMFAAKRISTNEISLVIERINWTSNSVYAYYQDDANMFALDNNGFLVKRFYIKNRFDQVFKCLWNNDGGTSTVEPYFQPGTFNANQIFQGADDYKWKYMYTITSGSKLKFMDDEWMPVPIGSNIPNPVETFPGSGSIDVINVTSSGSGYDPTNAAVTITVTGDGRFAAANAVFSGNTLVDISVANTGSNYTYANVVISSSSGSGATAVAYTSPPGGHGYDPASELGARNVMITATFNKDESGKLPTDIDFRQIGVLVNPFAYYGTVVDVANGQFYDVSTNFTMSQGFGDYVPDEIVYQSPNGIFESATFTATVLSFNGTTNNLKLLNTFGTANNNAILYGQTSQTARVVLQQNPSDFIQFSGYLTYLENKEPIQRNEDGSELFKLVLGY